jgi:replicative DNA helicase
MSAVFSSIEELSGKDRQVAQLRIPPHSIEAESSVLGGLLLDNSAWDRIGDMLQDGDFYRYEHRQIFASLMALINTSRPADVITVFEHLQGVGKAEEIGGLAYLNALAQYVPSASNRPTTTVPVVSRLGRSCSHALPPGRQTSSAAFAPNNAAAKAPPTSMNCGL